MSRYIARCIIITSLLLTSALTSYALWGYGHSKKIAPHIEEVYGWSYWNSYDADSKKQIGHKELHFVLAAYTKYHNNVRLFDYKAAKKVQQSLGRYLATMARLDPKTLNKDEQLAYWLNIYNAITIKIVLEHYPLLSLKEVKLRETFYGKVIWDVNQIKINRTSLSLNDIEHNILRAFWDPKLVFYGINHANISDPEVISYPFAGRKVYSQLETLAERMINNDQLTEIKDKTIYVSGLYKWHLMEFGGRSGLKQHLLKLSSGRKKEKLSAAIKNNYAIKFKPYDWTINDYDILTREFKN
jgi:hypothetical protein